MQTVFPSTYMWYRTSRIPQTTVVIPSSNLWSIAANPSPRWTCTFLVKISCLSCPSPLQATWITSLTPTPLGRISEVWDPQCNLTHKIDTSGGRRGRRWKTMREGWARQDDFYLRWVTPSGWNNLMFCCGPTASWQDQVLVRAGEGEKFL